MTQTTAPDPAASVSVPELPVTRMNITHHEEATLVGRIADCLTGPSPCKQLDALLADWVAHTEAHFERENRWMEQYGFPAYPVHAGEHERVLGQLKSLCAEWRKTGDTDALTHYVTGEWPRWFEHHLLTMDRVTAGFLAQAAGPDLE